MKTKTLFLIKTAALKYLLPLPILCFAATMARAQKITFGINASANLTMVPDFNNRLFIADGFVVPGQITPTNARNMSTVNTTSTTTAGIGFTAEAEAGLALNDAWKLSLSLGVLQLRYDYDTYIAQSFYRNNFSLGEAFSEYGNTRLTYLTARPANISYTNKRFMLQGGPIVNYLIGEKTTNTVVIYNASTGEAAGAFFEEKGDAQKFLFGGHLNVRYAIAGPLQLMLGGQYFFNSLYGKDTFAPMRDESKALQVQLGVSYQLAKKHSK